MAPHWDNFVHNTGSETKFHPTCDMIANWWPGGWSFDGWIHTFSTHNFKALGVWDQIQWLCHFCSSNLTCNSSKHESKNGSWRPGHQTATSISLLMYHVKFTASSRYLNVCCCESKGEELTPEGFNISLAITQICRPTLGNSWNLHSELSRTIHINRLHAWISMCPLIPEIVIPRIRAYIY